MPDINSVTIREAVESDGEAYHAHMQRILREPMIDTPFALDEYPFNAAQEAQRIRMHHRAINSLFLLALSQDSVVGSLRLSGKRLRVSQHCADLALYIDKNYRGLGLGQGLMRHALDWARESQILHRIQLEVYTRNEGAMHLYRKFGFEIEGLRRKAFFQDGEWQDEYFMALLF